MAYDPKAPRLRKAKYSSQDVRTKALEARDELMAQVEFLTDCIREDRHKLMAYREKYGDLQYRPLISPGSESIEPTYGLPTGVAIEPLASQLRASISSFLQSIRLIQSEILPEDNPEGATTQDETSDSSQKSASLRETFLKEASQDKTPIQPTEPDEDIDEVPTELVETAKPKPKSPSKPATAQAALAEPNSIPNKPKPWRDETPRAQAAVKQNETKSIPQTTPHTQLVDNHPERKTQDTSTGTKPQIGLSPALRMALGNGAPNRLDSIRDKYRSGTSKIVAKKTSDAGDES